MAEQPVLVAGKSGQLARCLHDSAILHNVPIVVVGRPELDLEKGEGINRVMAAVEPSAIVNAAAYTAVDQAEAESGRSFRVNCGGAALLADAATRRGIPFIHISTDYVFDGSKQSPYREDDAPAPLNVYGSSKLAGEAAVLKVCPGAVVIVNDGNVSLSKPEVRGAAISYARCCGCPKRNQWCGLWTTSGGRPRPP